MTYSLPAGLRERKKAKTRAAIREAAMQLFESQGFAATTVEQIAEAAEVSPSTFFRYFPTKEDVVLTDDYDPMIIEAVRRQPAGTHPIDAIIQGMRDVFGSMTEKDLVAEQQRQRIFQSVPELQARILQQTVGIVGMVGEVLAEREGRPADDLGCRVMAGAIIGVVLSVMPVGHAGFEFYDLDRIAEALTLLRDGLPLG